jgi:chaperone modulatory protein CbpM
VQYTFYEVAELCETTAAEITDLITEGIVTPVGAGPGTWRFTGASVLRVRTALRLEAELGLNRAGAALALELLERVAELERRLRELGAE